MPAVRRRPSPLLRLLPALLLFAAGLLLGRSTAGATAEGAFVPVPEPAVSTPVLGLFPAPEGLEPVSSEDSWELTLVNWERPLPEGFSVPELTWLRNGQAIDSRAYPALQAMMDAARAEGLQPLICSSWRTWAGQEGLYEAEVDHWRESGLSLAEAEAQAATWVARPGTSEHQLGLAVDIVDMAYQVLDQGQEDTPIQQWLMAHCAEYGFILRYPSEKSGLTGVSYEPWHYRYVGEKAAQEIMAGGLCLEEYLED